MKLLAYEVDKRSFLGIFNEDETWVYPISAAGMEYRSMKDLIREAGPSEMEMLDYISKKAPGRDQDCFSDPGAGSGYHLPGDQLYGSCGGIREVPERGVCKT